MQKRNGERKDCEEKRKEVKGDHHIKGYGSQIFKSRSRSTVKGSWSETWRDYIRLLDASILKFSKEKDLFCESYELFKILCHIWFFGHISKLFELFWIYSFEIL